MSAIEELHCDTVAEFIQFLRPSNALWSGSVSWVFRGQANAEWSLIPSAWRKDGIEILENYIIKNKHLANAITNKRLEVTSGQTGLYDSDPEFVEKHYLLTRAEIGVVNDFSEFAAQLGFPVQDKVVELNWKESNWNPGRPMTYPVLYQHSMANTDFPLKAGLAQHHGIPTRLLDWTYDGLRAAYFSTVQRNNFVGERLAVWALRTDLTPDTEIRLLSYPPHRHEYLKAQRGLFTLIDSADDHYCKEREWPSLEGKAILLPTHFHPAIYKITLPNRLCNELEDVLWHEQISEAHLMPGYSSVASTLKNRWGR